MTEHRRRLLKRKLQESRCRLYKKDMDFASPLKEMIFVATKDVRRISTNGRCIYLDPDWLQKLGKRELDFMLSHQLMHIVLGHVDRPKYYKGDRFHLACDIVANSTLTLYGWEYDKLPNVGEIFCETFYPARSGLNMTAQEAFECIPFDPAARRKGTRNSYVIDSETWWDRKDDCGNDGIILLSPQDKDPDDLDCDEPAAEIIHPKFQKEFYVKKEIFLEIPEEVEGNKTTAASDWTTDSVQNIEQLRHEKNNSKSMGEETNFYERVWRRYSDGTLDWRSLLSSFIQEEVCDYSFVPPDRRMQEFDVYLPDYNVLKETPKQVLFMVDTSGSVSDDALATVYAEISRAINQFNGGLVGQIGFFDNRVYTPTSFADADELLGLKPIGGGGTDFYCIFRYIERNMGSEQISNIVIFTDGQAEFPNVSRAGNIPVLWLLSDKTVTPPWGEYAYV